MAFDEMPPGTLLKHQALSIYSLDGRLQKTGGTRLLGGATQNLPGHSRFGCPGNWRPPAGSHHAAWFGGSQWANTTNDLRLSGAVLLMEHTENAMFTQRPQVM